MSKAVKQYRFYNTGNSSNQPSNISSSRLASGSIFFSDSNLGSITQLGIQTLPGTKFYLNGSTDPIIIGTTGIYELDLEGISEITSLSFNSKSLERIASLDTAYLIVDAIYEAEEEEEE